MKIIILKYCVIKSVLLMLHDGGIRVGRKERQLYMCVYIYANICDICIISYTKIRMHILIT